MDSTISPIHEEPQTIEGTPKDAWNKLNLLSLDGGGVRGYWSLLAVSKLMEYVAIEEENAENEDPQAPPVYSSFSPKDYPSAISHVPETQAETDEVNNAAPNQISRRRATLKTRRYLPCHYFDYICGSSTGALIAIMLGRFRMTVLDCIHEYITLGEEVFGKPRFFTEIHFPIISHRAKYDADKLKKVFEDVAARRAQSTTHEAHTITFPADRDLCKTFVTSLMSYSDQGAVEKLHLLRSYDHNPRHKSDGMKRPSRTGTTQTTHSYTGSFGGPEKTPIRRHVNYGSASTFQIWEVARAATAAPWYFDGLKVPIRSRPPKDQLFTDGGFDYTNNPTGQGVSEIKEANGNGSVGIVVSIGTARHDQCPTRSLKSRLTSGFSRGTDPERIHHDMEGASAGDGGFSYHRLNDPGALNVKLDEWKPNGILIRGKSGSATISKIENSFYKWAQYYGVVAELKQCAIELVRQRRSRASDQTLWERYATGAKFTCYYPGCGGGSFTIATFLATILPKDTEYRRIL